MLMSSVLTSPGTVPHIHTHTHIQTHTCGGFIRDLYSPEPVTKQVESARKLFPCFLPVDVIVPALYWVVLP